MTASAVLSDNEARACVTQSRRRRRRRSSCDDLKSDDVTSASAGAADLHLFPLAGCNEWSSAPAFLLHICESLYRCHKSQSIMGNPSGRLTEALKRDQ